MDSPHDRLFKTTFSQPGEAASLLASVLPRALVKRIDWSTLELVSPESVDAGLDRRQADLIYRVRVGHRDARLLVVFEHQSRVDPRMPLRLLTYMTRTWERFVADEPDQPLPVIVPVVLYHGQARWTAARSLVELFELDEVLASTLQTYVPSFTFVLDDLTKLRAAGLRTRGLTPWATMALVLLAWCRGSAHPERVLRRWLDVLGALATSSQRREALTAVATYLLWASAGRADRLRVVFAQAASSAEEVFMTPAEQLLRKGRRQGKQKGRQEGRQEGRHEGRQEGLREGRVQLLVSLLSTKFGVLPKAVQERLSKASPEALERYATQLLVARSLDEALR